MAIKLTQKQLEVILKDVPDEKKEEILSQLNNDEEQEYISIDEYSNAYQDCDCGENTPESQKIKKQFEEEHPNYLELLMEYYGKKSGLSDETIHQHKIASGMIDENEKFVKRNGNIQFNKKVVTVKDFYDAMQDCDYGSNNPESQRIKKQFEEEHPDDCYELVMRYLEEEDRKKRSSATPAKVANNRKWIDPNNIPDLPPVSCLPNYKVNNVSNNVSSSNSSPSILSIVFSIIGILFLICFAVSSIRGCAKSIAPDKNSNQESKEQYREYAPPPLIGK